MTHRYTTLKRICISAGASLVMLCGACRGQANTQAEEAKAEAAAEAAIQGDAAAEAAIQGDAVDANAVIATVDGTKLTRGEVDMQIMQMLAARGLQGLPPEQIEQFRPMVEQQIVRNFVVNTVLRNEAKRLQVEAPQDKITQTLDDIKSRAPEGMTLDDLLAQAGMTQEQLQQDIADSIRVQALLETQTEGKLAVTEEEMQAYYTESKDQFDEPEEVQARHILLTFAEDDDDAAKAEKRKSAEAIRKELLDGADFAAVAKARSDCPSSSEGGDLGRFGKGRMVKEFEDAAFEQKVNEIGPVVETQFGYHIIQVTEHADAGQKSFDEVRDRIQDILKDGKRREIVQTYVETLEKAADITYAEQD